jgi:hypothetical protein
LRSVGVSHEGVKIGINFAKGKNRYYIQPGSTMEIMRHGIVVLGFLIIVLILITGCSSQTPSRTLSSAPSISTTSPGSPAQPVSHDVNSIQTFSKDGTSFTTSIDSISSSPGPGGQKFGLLMVNFTFTNTGTEPLKFNPTIKIITEHPSESFKCSDPFVCNTTRTGVYFLTSEGSSYDITLYPGVPRNGTSNKWFEKREYEALKQGMFISFIEISVGSMDGQKYKTYIDMDPEFPIWKIDFAKDVTILPA